MLISGKKVLQAAKKKKYAVGSFNTSTLECTRAIFMAAKKSKAPVILQTSEGEINHLGPEIIAAIAQILAKEFSIDIALHLDHGHGLDIIKKALSAGFTSVHFDGSSHPFEKNIALTKKVVALAKKYKASVEGELGQIKGSSSLHSTKLIIEKKELTDPKQAGEFVERTGIDYLACAVGSAHGIYKSVPKLDIERIKEIAGKVNIPLVLHGGSGIPTGQIKEAIKAGVCKINVNTELRIAYTEALKKSFKKDPKEVIPYNYLPATIPAIEKVVSSKIKIFGSANKI